MRILIVEDDAALSEQLTRRLRSSGYAVDAALTAEAASERAGVEPYDLIVLDLGLPEMDGLTLLEQWRHEGMSCCVLVLTARGTWRDRVQGLRAGADDYLPKPFEPEELLARIEALLRRAAGHAHAVLGAGDVEIDTSARTATRAGCPVALTALEYRLIAYLMLHDDQVHSKATLTEHIYEQDFDKDSNVIEVLVNRLRKKLGRDLIETRRGVGYQICKDRARS